jgi:hypothetical protein
MSRFSLFCQGASVGQEPPRLKPSMLQSAAHVGRAVGQELENSVGQAVGHPEVPETEASVFDGAGVQVAAAEPVEAVFEPESDPEGLLVLSRGLTSLPPLALE